MTGGAHTSDGELNGIGEGFVGRPRVDHGQRLCTHLELEGRIHTK